MKMIDLICRACEKVTVDFLQRDTTGDPPYDCTDCGGEQTVTRVHLQKPSNVIGDEIDIWIEHGLCNADGSPRRYQSKQEIYREAKARGLVNMNEHIGSPGSDRNRKGYTTRWV